MFDYKTITSKKTKIIATIGPSTQDLEVMERLFLQGGVTVFRVNFSHATHDVHRKTIENVRKVSKKYNYPLAVLSDMCGPKLRVGKFKNGSAELEAGQTFLLDLNPEEGDNKRVCLPHTQIFEAVRPNNYLLVDDGKIKLKVVSVESDKITTSVVIPGVISNFKGVNFPSGVLNISSLTEKDLKDLDFALKMESDYIALSFVQTAKDVEFAQNIIKGRAKIISKIEKPSAVENIDAIVNKSDAIMVARGDLGVELPAPSIPAIQKTIIRECRRQNVPVIVATQMLDSMTFSLTPSRAEVSDVANAVYDGADAVMLSGETTVGDYPVETVEMMHDIIKGVQDSDLYWKGLERSYKNIQKEYFESHHHYEHLTIGRAISIASKSIAEHLDAKVIVTFSYKGTTINRISHQRPHATIFGLTTSPKLYNQMSLNWGVRPLFYDTKEDISFTKLIDFAQAWLKEHGWVQKGDKIVVVCGIPLNVGGITNSLRVVVVS